MAIIDSSTNVNAEGIGAQAAGGNIYNINNDMPMIFDPQKLADIINTLYKGMNSTADPINDFSRPKIEEKNKLNDISDNFFEDCIKENYENFSKIEMFFKNPSNNTYKEKYKHILTEVKGKIIARTEAGESMMQILASLLDFAKTGDRIKLFEDNSYLVNILSYFMYVNCDIGKKKE